MIELKEKIADSIVYFLKDNGIDFKRQDILVQFKKPEKLDFGDIAFPVFRFAKDFRKPPVEIAGMVKDFFESNPLDEIEKIEVINGYVNFHISPEWMFNQLVSNLNSKGDNFYKQDVLKDKTFVVEFSSPNIAKPFSIGHLRSTVIGNFLRNLLKALGANVIGINHIGDWGTQFGKLIVAFRLWGNEEELEKDPVKYMLNLYVRFHKEAEENPELEDKAREAFLRLEKGEEEERNLWEKFRSLSLKEFEKTYKRLNVHFDKVLGEAFYSDKIDRVIKILEEKKLLEESENALVVKLDDYNMPPCLIKKSDGATLYATRDIAAAIYRKETFNFDKMLYVVGSEQKLHFRQFIKVLELAGFEWAKNMEHIDFGLYRFKDGKMSTRKGKVVLLEEVLDEAVKRIRDIMEEKNPDLTKEERENVAEVLGTGAIIFNDLKNDRIKDVQFSWDEVLNFEGESGPYIAYSYVRCNGILRNAESVKESENYKATHDSEISLIKKLFEFKEIMLIAYNNRKSHFIANYLLDLTKSFTTFYHNCRVIGESDDISSFRKMLVKLTMSTLKAGAEILGMRLPDRM
ncbi:arginyl-tRNA synthetase [Thermotomaculum hydrothermale]|uniref:Arginine--tRNA ligase n=1 Tax=Thermotomaculum hydrothermale TaxID=981385 RepID=A0A7R6PM76_9BACT|nr:arginine--tRNA ligase [Thermotomaculum hydrothermale]BBB31701.1 arginyl-tRNA synthetase [Thermotomaculum hydrothermale]